MARMETIPEALLASASGSSLLASSLPNLKRISSPIPSQQAITSLCFSRYFLYVFLWTLPRLSSDSNTRSEYLLWRLRHSDRRTVHASMEPTQRIEWPPIVPLRLFRVLGLDCGRGDQRVLGHSIRLLTAFETFTPLTPTGGTTTRLGSTGRYMRRIYRH